MPFRRSWLTQNVNRIQIHSVVQMFQNKQRPAEMVASDWVACYSGRMCHAGQKIRTASARSASNKIPGRLKWYPSVNNQVQGNYADAGFVGILFELAVVGRRNEEKVIASTLDCFMQEEKTT